MPLFKSKDNEILVKKRSQMYFNLKLDIFKNNLAFFHLQKWKELFRSYPLQGYTLLITQQVAVSQNKLHFGVPFPSLPSRFTGLI